MRKIYLTNPSNKANLKSDLVTDALYAFSGIDVLYYDAEKFFLYSLGMVVYSYRGWQRVDVGRVLFEEMYNEFFN